MQIRILLITFLVFIALGMNPESQRVSNFPQSAGTIQALEFYKLPKNSLIVQIFSRHNSSRFIME